MPTERSRKSKALQDDAKEFVTLAKTYNPKVHVITPKRKVETCIKGWGIHEKLDGVRARWHNGYLISRTRRRFPVPDEVLVGLSVTLGFMEVDGELVHKDGDFQKTVSIVKNGHSTLKDWEKIEYHIFDVVSDGDYNTRMDRLSILIGKPKAIKITWPLDYVNKERDITENLDWVLKQGGEGIMIRNHDAPYETGRTKNLLKVKAFKDIEVTVVGHEEGDGRNKGRLGALLCELDNGKPVKIGTGFTDADRENPPAIGARVTCKFFDYTNGGIPRFPVFVTVRDYE
jgi:DNA ligase-1